MASPRTKLVRPGDAPARLHLRPRVDAAPGDDGFNAASFKQFLLALPVLLAGPILRRAAPDAVYVWVATSAPIVVEGSVISPPAAGSATADQWTVLGRGRGDTMRLGAHLYLSLVRITPSGAPFPLGKILGYDLVFTAPPDSEFTDESGLLGLDEIAYQGFPVPTFTLGLGADARKLNVLHASCRKFHGPGQDAMEGLDAYLASVSTNPDERPSALLLTGDQIYADDVDSGVLSGIQIAAPLLFGWNERLPDGRKPSDVSRGDVVRDAGFTVDQGARESHLLAFAEFAVMYLLAWSKALWKQPLVDAQMAFDRSKWEKSVGAAQRALANVPCYMMMDDHEVSDDWPLTAQMRDIIKASDVGSWVVANGWAACWAFQLAGNASGLAQNPPFRDALLAYLTLGASLPDKPTDAQKAQMSEATKKYASAVLATRGFTFSTATSPPIIVLDERTQRDLHETTAPGRLDGAGFGALRTEIQKLPGGGAPVLIVAPGPVIGYATIEVALQRPKEGEPLNVKRDPEAWSFDAKAYYTLFDTILQTGRLRAVFFSGDVHYAYMAAGQFRKEDAPSATLDFIQLTSSPLRNEPDVAQRGGMTLLRGVRYVGKNTWSDVSQILRVNADDRPERYFLFEPAEELSLYRLYRGAKNTSAQRLGIMRQSYLQVDGSSPVYGQNNFGVVRVTWNDQGVAEVMQQLRGATFVGNAVRASLP